jgi:hypothetical protein
MTLKLVDYFDIVKNNDVLTGTMILLDGSKMKISDKIGSSLEIKGTNSAMVNLIMEPVAGGDSFSGGSIASYQQMHFKDDTTFFNSNPNYHIRGDVRLYRDSDYFLRAKTTMTASNQPDRPQLTAYITLSSLDNRKYEGHVRFVNQSRNKIITYSISGSTSTGLSVENDGMYFNLSSATPTSIPFWQDGNDFAAMFPDGSGSLVVARDSASGKLIISQLRLTIGTFANYYAVDNISTINALTPD